MAKPEHNARHERKRREAGWVRGPRISGQASERLRELAFQHRLDPCEVVTRLILCDPLGAADAVPETADAVAEAWARSEYQRRIGLSDCEMADMDRLVADIVGSFREMITRWGSEMSAEND